MKKLKVFEAFAGYGSQRMALRNIGINFESVGISEIDIHAILSYASIHENISNNEFNFPSKEEMVKYLEDRNIGLDFKTNKIKLPKNLNKLKDIYKAVVLSKCYGDISKLNIKELDDFDLFTYSFPCQDLSVAGKMKGLERGKTRSGLLYECEKIIENKRPKYLLLENVKNLVSKKFKNQFDEWLKYLESLGYTNYWKVLNAKDYSIPQNRERVFVVSILNNDVNYEFPKEQELRIRLKDLLEEHVDDKYYLSEEVQLRFKPNKNFYNMNGNIVGTTAPDFRTIGQRDLCYQENSIIGALVATDYKQPKQIIEINEDKLSDCGYTICEKRYDEGIRYFKDNVCGTLRTIDSCGNKMIIEEQLNKNKSKAINIIEQLANKEQLNDDITTCDMTINDNKAKDISNCITARYDCGVSNLKSTGTAIVERIGGCFDDEKSTHQAGSVYNENGLAPTLDTMQGGYRQPCIQVEGKLECEGWHDIETRVHNVDGLAPCVETKNRAKYIENYRIRKLTPLECWRLMGCSDEDFYKAQKYNSDTQLYKQAGNSIVINVLEEIFKNLFLK